MVKPSIATVQKSLDRIEKRLARLEKASQQDLAADAKIAASEQEEIDHLAELEELEKRIETDVKPHPLTKITYRDFTKGVIGSFFGVVGHFAFFYGNKIAHDMTIARAHALLITSLAILILFIYFSGFRRIKEYRNHKFIPWRVIVIYGTAHLVIAFVLLLFGIIGFESGLVEIYKNIAAVSILAVMGAATADLIGQE